MPGGHGQAARASITVVRDADAARQDGFAAEHPGALAAGSPDAFAPADIVVTMLPMSSSDPSDTVALAAAAGADAPVLALADDRWARALGQLGPVADQSMAHRAWWADHLADQ